MSFPGINLDIQHTAGLFKERENLAADAEIESSLPRYQPGIYNHFPEEVNDGRIGINHGWAASTSETGHWIKLDLGKETNVDMVRIANFVGTPGFEAASKRCKIVIIDSDLNTVLSQRVTLKKLITPEFQNFTLTPVKGRYVQIVIDSYYHSGGGGLAEVEIYGSNNTILTPHIQTATHQRVQPPELLDTTQKKTAPEITEDEYTLPSSINFGRYHAIVIGNNNYRALPKLNTAVNDARVVAQLLEKSYNYNVTLLENATRYDILTAFGKMRNELTGRDNLLIYYAGHGWIDSDGDEGYWLPVDATRSSRVNWVSNASITTDLKALRAKHVLVVADSCYSGKLTRGLSIKQRKPGYLEHASKLRVRSALASGGLEPVADNGLNGHSVFAGAFIKALNENDGVLLGEQLFQRIFRPVKLNSDQTPEYADIRKAGHEGGDFIFIKK